ncbi:MAG: glycosyl hydrolase 53 family protein [Bacteroidetes bacterium]|nr:glycosyl hydrolase 53 family protein [Bacteroidota bacterium]
MRPKLFLTAFFLLIISCGKDNVSDNSSPDNFIRGADLSYLPEIETYSIRFYDAEGKSKDVLTILKEAGCNTIRLRLWYAPPSNHSGFDEVLAFSERIKNAGLKVYLTVHYSDTWADPGKQTIPLTWQNLNIDQLKDSIYAYTYRIMTAIQPDFISIGNEINSGLLWDLGQIDHPANFIALLKEGTRAVRDASGKTKIIIHFAGIEGSDWFFNLISTNTVDFDIIGISYYPFWHGKDLESMKNALTSLSNVSGKEILIAETAYPFTLGWNDWTNNIIGTADQLVSGYPATPQGQASFMLAMKEAIRSVNKGIGFCYWGGEWIAFKGPQSTNGSNWENLTLFDFDNKALPVMSVFKKEP